LTLEPNTVFYKYPPPLPSDDHISEIQTAGQKLLAEHGYQQYEVSAYAKPNKQCQHNLNYWQFGDYLGIGAGAHGKITDLTNGKIHRTQKFKVPMAYMTKLNDPNNTIVVNQQDIIFEFMLNALRLQQDLDFALFTERTDLSVDLLMPILAHAKQKGFIEYSNRALHILPLGRQYLNDLVMLFLP